MKRKVLLLFLVIGFSLSAARVCAQEEKNKKNDENVDLYALSLEELMNIRVVSASKVEQKQSEAPNIISTLSNKTFRQLGLVSINDALFTQPGFSPAQDYDRRTVGFRGMYEGWNNNHLLMLVDGIPFNDNLYGTAYTWEITPSIIMKTLEIVRGPGGALYGTNAMNGVVTINTLNASDLKGVGEVRARFGTKNTQIYDVLFGTEGQNLGVVAAFNSYSTDGLDYETLDASGRTDANGNLMKFKVKDERSSNYLFTKIYGLGNLEGLSLQYHEQHWGFETGHGWLFLMPDIAETMKENRRIVSLRYAPRVENRMINYELTTRYQRHTIDWNMRFYPDNTNDGYGNYQYGISEYLKTNADDVFLRLQADYHNEGVGRFLAGVEGTYFYYDGDAAHFSNVNLNGNYLPFPDNDVRAIDPWFEFVKNKPVKNIGWFGQYISPKFGGFAQLTLSGRFDKQFFDYTDIYDNDTEKHKDFDLFTPRAALVLTPTEDLSIKLIAGKAFRTPAPTEMFGANTFTLASNIGQLEPETVFNYDLGMEYKVNKNVHVKANGFYVNFENQIAYSVANANLSTNIYTLKTVGLETEVNYSFGHFSGFANATFAKRLEEEIMDNTIAESDEKVTWAPATSAKLGVIYEDNKFYSSLFALYQGKVNRRSSDYDVSLNTNLRPENVNAWVDVNTKFAYKLNENTEVGLLITNLLNTNQTLIKNNAYPFDYKRAERGAMLDILVKF